MSHIFCLSWPLLLISVPHSACPPSSHPLFDAAGRTPAALNQLQSLQPMPHVVSKTRKWILFFQCHQTLGYWLSFCSFKFIIFLFKIESFLEICKRFGFLTVQTDPLKFSLFLTLRVYIIYELGPRFIVIPNTSLSWLRLPIFFWLTPALQPIPSLSSLSAAGDQPGCHHKLNLTKNELRMLVFFTVGLLLPTRLFHQEWQGSCPDGQTPKNTVLSEGQTQTLLSSVNGEKTFSHHLLEPLFFFNPPNPPKQPVSSF